MVVVELRDGMSAGGLERLCATIVAAAREHRDVLCLVQGADLSVVDALARVELLHRRLGLRCRVLAARPAVLAGLLELTGLREAVTGGLEVLGEPEPPEQ